MPLPSLPAIPAIPSLPSIANMALPFFKEIATRDMGSLLSSIKPPMTPDISSISIGSAVSSDKIMKAVSDSATTSNVFGVFDTKQVVKSLTGDTPSLFSTESLVDLDVKKYTTMATKAGSAITSDLDFNSAVSSTIDNVTDIKQMGFTSPDALFTSSGSDYMVYDKYTGQGGSGYSYLDDMQTGVQNYGTEAITASYIPNTVSPTDFNSMKSIFNGVNGNMGLNHFSSCPNLNDIFNWANNLLGIDALFGQLKALIDMINKYNLRGLLSCLENAGVPLSVGQRQQLSGSLISGGSIGGLSEFNNIGNSGMVSNKYSTARSVGMNATTAPPRTAEDTDALFRSLNIDKADVYLGYPVTSTDQQSTLRNINDSVYDRAAISSTPTTNGFRDFCFDGSGTDQLISAVPDSLFV